MLAWQSQYGDIRKELKEAEGTNETLRVSFCHGVITTQENTAKTPVTMTSLPALMLRIDNHFLPRRKS